MTKTSTFELNDFEMVTRRHPYYGTDIEPWEVPTLANPDDQTGNFTKTIGCIHNKNNVLAVVFLHNILILTVFTTQYLDVFSTSGYSTYPHPPREVNLKCTL